MNEVKRQNQKMQVWKDLKSMRKLQVQVRVEPGELRVNSQDLTSNHQREMAGSQEPAKNKVL